MRVATHVLTEPTTDGKLMMIACQSLWRGSRKNIQILSLLIGATITISTVSAYAADLKSQRSDNYLPSLPDAEGAYLRLWSATRSVDNALAHQGNGVVVAADGYSLNRVMRELFKRSFLGDVERKSIEFVKLRNWIINSPSEGTLDAFVGRLHLAEGTVHVCDSRPLTVVAWRDTRHDTAFLRDPKSAIHSIADRLFRFGLPEKVQLSWDPDHNVPATLFNVTLEPENANSSTETKLSFDVLGVVFSDRVVVFEIRKRRFPGLNTDPALPLFMTTDHPAVKLRERVESLRIIAEQKDPVEYVKSANGLLLELSTDAQSNDGDKLYEFKRLEARMLTLSEIGRVLRSVNNIDTLEVLVRHTTETLTLVQDLHVGPKILLKQELYGAIDRIGSGSERGRELLAALLVEEEHPSFYPQFGKLVASVDWGSDDKVSKMIEELLARVASVPDGKPSRTSAIIRSLRADFPMEMYESLLRRLESATDSGEKQRHLSILSSCLADVDSIRWALVSALLKKSPFMNRPGFERACIALSALGDIRVLGTEDWARVVQARDADRAIQCSCVRQMIVEYMGSDSNMSRQWTCKEDLLVQDLVLSREQLSNLLIDLYVFEPRIQAARLVRAYPSKRDRRWKELLEQSAGIENEKIHKQAVQGAIEELSEAQGQVLFAAHLGFKTESALVTDALTSKTLSWSLGFAEMRRRALPILEVLACSDSESIANLALTSLGQLNDLLVVPRLAAVMQCASAEQQATCGDMIVRITGWRKPEAVDINGAIKWSQSVSDRLTDIHEACSSTFVAADLKPNGGTE